MLTLPGTPLDRALWASWVAMFGILESLGIARAWGSTSLTRLTLAIVPKWALAMFFGWAIFHFFIQYLPS